MKPIIMACAQEQVNIRLKSVLSQQGFFAENTVNKAASLLSLAQKMHGGVAVLTGFKDFPIASLTELLPDGFCVLALVQSGRFAPACSPDRLTLPLPIDRPGFLQSVSLLAVESASDLGVLRAIDKNDGEYAKTLTAAKNVLMSRYDMSEADAHRFIQKRSMDCGVKLIDMASFVISSS